MSEYGKHREEFERLTNPVIKWLNDHWHPHVHIIIDQTSAEVSEGLLAHKTEEFLEGGKLKPASQEDMKVYNAIAENYHLDTKPPVAVTEDTDTGFYFECTFGHWVQLPDALAQHSPTMGYYSGGLTEQQKDHLYALIIKQLDEYKTINETAPVKKKSMSVFEWKTRCQMHFARRRANIGYNYFYDVESCFTEYYVHAFGGFENDPEGAADDEMSSWG